MWKKCTFVALREWCEQWGTAIQEREDEPNPEWTVALWFLFDALEILVDLILFFPVFNHQNSTVFTGLLLMYIHATYLQVLEIHMYTEM